MAILRVYTWKKQRKLVQSRNKYICLHKIYVVSVSIQFSISLCSFVGFSVCDVCLSVCDVCLSVCDVGRWCLSYCMWCVMSVLLYVMCDVCLTVCDVWCLSYCMWCLSFCMFVCSSCLQYFRHLRCIFSVHFSGDKHTFV